MAKAKPQIYNPQGKVWTWVMHGVKFTSVNPPGVFGPVEAHLSGSSVKGIHMITPWNASLVFVVETPIVMPEDLGSSDTWASITFTNSGATTTYDF